MSSFHVKGYFVTFWLLQKKYQLTENFMKEIHFVINLCVFVRKTFFLCIMMSIYIKGIFLVPAS